MMSLDRAAGMECMVLQLLAVVSCARAETMFNVLTAAGESPNEDLKYKNVEVYPGSDNCHVTGQVPQLPRSLSFCHKFNDGACCLPQLDDENNEFYGQLTNLGLACRIRGDIRTDPLATFYCINCDPEQPDYIRLGMSSLDDDAGTPYSENGGNGTHGGDYNGITGTTGDPVGYSDPDGDKQTILVDVEWAQIEFKVSPLLSGPENRLSSCGLLVSVPCMGIEPGGDPAELDGRDRYVCGDDLVIPTNPDHGVLVANASNEWDYLINASLENFLNFPSLGPPLLDESFYFKLVQNRPCNETETTTYLNPHCLRTATQLTTLINLELQRNFGVEMTYRDWVCAFSSEDDPTGWTPDASHNNFCASVDCGLTPQEQAQAKLDNACCCGTWKNEKAFSSAAVSRPQFLAMFALVVAAVFLIM